MREWDSGWDHGTRFPMNAEAFLTATNHLSELERLNSCLSRFCSENHLPDNLATELEIALEEVFVNVVRHGYRDSSEHQISVRIAVENGEVILAVEDDGVPFNPLDAPAVDTSLPIEDRPVGGLGIHLVRSLMSEVRYAREEGRNHLEMRKHIQRNE